MFPNAKEIPSPYYAEPVVVDRAQSLALHLYKDLPGRILRHSWKEPHELVDVVRTSLKLSYENWLQQGGCASQEVHENPMTSAGDVHLDGGDNSNNKVERKDSTCSGSHNSETEHLPSDLNMTSDDREICRVPASDS